MIVNSCAFRRGAGAAAVAGVMLVVSCQKYPWLKPSSWLGNKTSHAWAHVSADGGADAGALTDELAGRCTIPVHEDTYYGFSIGYPQSWLIDYTTGTIVVSKDEKNLVGALVFPARLRRTDIAADRFADAFADGLEKVIKEAGGTFEVTDRVTDGKIARAMVHATVDGVPLRGPLQVVETPGFITLKLYWAPVTSFDSEEATLKQVVTCFQRKTVITAKHPVAPAGGPVTRVGGAPKPQASATAGLPPMKATRSRYFTMSVPDGWKVTDENPNGIDLLSADGSEAVGFGWVLGPTGSVAAAQQQSLTQVFPGARALATNPAPAPAGWSSLSSEFEGVVRGHLLHGVTQTSVGNGVTMTYDWVTTPQKWDGSKAKLAAIAQSVQITPDAMSTVSAGVRAAIAAVQRPSSSSSSSDSIMSSWEQRQKSQDHIFQEFDDAIKGQDRARSPTTGEVYDCPYNSWNSSGPNGPGYYRAATDGSLEQLNVEQ